MGTDGARHGFAEPGTGLLARRAAPPGISSKYSPARRLVRRLTWRSERDSRTSPASRRMPVIQPQAVVDDYHDRRSRCERARDVREGLTHVRAIGGDCSSPGAPGRRADLVGRARLQTEQVEGVRVLRVVVEDPDVGRRGDDAVEPRRQQGTAGIGVQHLPGSSAAHGRKGLDAPQHVRRIAAQELRGTLGRRAHAPVLVAPVGRPYRFGGMVERVVPDEPRRAGGPAQHERGEPRPGRVGIDRVAIGAQLAPCLLAVPAKQMARDYRRIRPVGCLRCGRVDQAAERRRDCGFVRAQLLAREQHVEGRDVDAHRSDAHRDSLDERRSRSAERVENDRCRAKWRRKRASASWGGNLPR